MRHHFRPAPEAICAVEETGKTANTERALRRLLHGERHLLSLG